MMEIVIATHGAIELRRETGVPGEELKISITETNLNLKHNKVHAEVNIKYMQVNTRGILKHHHTGDQHESSGLNKINLREVSCSYYFIAVK